MGEGEEMTTNKAIETLKSNAFYLCINEGFPEILYRYDGAWMQFGTDQRLHDKTRNLEVIGEIGIGADYVNLLR